MGVWREEEQLYTNKLYERVWLRQVHGAIHYVIDFRLAVSDLDTMREVHGIVGFGLGSTLVYIKLKIGV